MFTENEKKILNAISEYMANVLNLNSSYQNSTVTVPIPIMRKLIAYVPRNSKKSATRILGAPGSLLQAAMEDNGFACSGTTHAFDPMAQVGDMCVCGKTKL